MSQTSTSTAADGGAVVSGGTPASASGLAAVDTLASVKAAALATAGGDQASLDAAVANAMAGKAPSNEFETWLTSMEGRMAHVENTIGTRAPAIMAAVNASADAAGQFSPAAAGLAARLPAMEAGFSQLLTALQSHFGGKIPGLPLPIAHRVPTAPNGVTSVAGTVLSALAR